MQRVGERAGVMVGRHPDTHDSIPVPNRNTPDYIGVIFERGQAVIGGGGRGRYGYSSGRNGENGTERNCVDGFDSVFRSGVDLIYEESDHFREWWWGGGYQGDRVSGSGTELGDQWRGGIGEP